MEKKATERISFGFKVMTDFQRRREVELTTNREVLIGVGAHVSTLESPFPPRASLEPLESTLSVGKSLRLRDGGHDDEAIFGESVTEIAKGTFAEKVMVLSQREELIGLLGRSGRGRHGFGDGV